MTTQTTQCMATWQDLLAEEKQKPYFKELLAKLNAAYKAGKTVYPPKKDIFNAINLCPYENVKVVIVGQDPYHGPNQAHGLSFSVQDGMRHPPSLINIFKEMANDLNKPIPQSGDLSYLAKQGVLLLNASLTVEKGQANSHATWGWQTFTDKIIHLVNDHPNPIVFMLWGSFAAKKCDFINTEKHLVLKAPHPSPLSAHRGYFGCKHFSKANDFLVKKHLQPINFI